MEDFYNNTLEDKSYNNSNIESDCESKIKDIMRSMTKFSLFRNVTMSIIVSISLPLALLAIRQLYSLVRKDHVAPIYIINLLISDIIQLCTTIVDMATPKTCIITKTLISVYIYCLMTSVGFMVCVALERYLVIAWPLWYRFRRNIKTTVLVCVVVWILPLLLFFSFGVFLKALQIIFGVFFFIPLPLFIFFLFGTVKALSAAISVPTDEKRRIMAILVLVLLIYTLLFLPAIIYQFAEATRTNETFRIVSVTFVRLSPLADLFLYVFSKKGAGDKFLACVCRYRMDNSDGDVIVSDVNSRSM